MSVHVLLAMLYFQTLPCTEYQQDRSQAFIANTAYHGTVIRSSAVRIGDVQRLLGDGEDALVGYEGVVLASNRSPCMLK